MTAPDRQPSRGPLAWLRWLFGSEEEPMICPLNDAECELHRRCMHPAVCPQGLMFDAEDFFN